MSLGEATGYKNLKSRCSSSLRSEFHTLIMLLNCHSHQLAAADDRAHFDMTVSSDVVTVINAESTPSPLRLLASLCLHLPPCFQDTCRS